jgi:hypothetical protein
MVRILFKAISLVNIHTISKVTILNTYSLCNSKNSSITTCLAKYYGEVQNKLVFTFNNWCLHEMQSADAETSVDSTVNSYCSIGEIGKLN